MLHNISLSAFNLTWDLSVMLNGVSPRQNWWLVSVTCH